MLSVVTEEAARSELTMSLDELAPHLIALVRAGARFEAGKLIERPGHTRVQEVAA